MNTDTDFLTILFGHTDAALDELVASIKASNNGRVHALAMTGAQKKTAEAAVTAGTLARHFMNFPGFGLVAAYSIAA